MIHNQVKSTLRNESQTKIIFASLFHWDNYHDCHSKSISVIWRNICLILVWHNCNWRTKPSGNSPYISLNYRTNSLPVSNSYGEPAVDCYSIILSYLGMCLSIYHQDLPVSSSDNWLGSANTLVWSEIISSTAVCLNMSHVRTRGEMVFTEAPGPVELWWSVQTPPSALQQPISGILQTSVLLSHGSFPCITAMICFMLHCVPFYH